MTGEESSRRIAEYLVRFFPTLDLRDGDDIFELGLVNSLFALQLVNFLEHAFGIAVENEDLELDNFRSIRAMSGLVQRKLAAASRAQTAG